MSPTQTRGCFTFLGLILFVAVFCVLTPFFIMPGLGFAVALPIITVPGEAVVYNGWLFGSNLTNTILALFFVNLVMLAPFVFFAWRSSKGWTREVPSGFQSLVEVIIETFYNFARGIAGDRLDAKRPLPLWPLVATIFIFLLAANLMKLFPGVETVGKLHCAYADFIGYPARQGIGETYTLYVDRPLDSGTTQTAETEAICNDYFKGYKKYVQSFPVESADEIEQRMLEAEERVAQLSGVGAGDLTDEAQRELTQAEYYVQFAPARMENARTLEELRAELALVEAEIATLEGTNAEAHGDEGEAGSHSEVTEAASEETAGEGAEPVVTEGEILGEAAEAEADAAAETDPAARLEDLKAQKDALQAAINLNLSQLRYPGATVPLSEEQLNNGALPFLFHITPFFRGATTDLSLTITWAFIAIVLVQGYGVATLGPGYFEKFVNLSALGNLGKKPLGAIDFIVGLIEIISEIGKIVSLAFRLFGNLFAGGVALIAITFLVSWFLPGIIFGLEIIIGSIQALVFAVLTLVFSAQAMESHHGDDHGDHHDDAHGAEAHH
ncbi:MAG: F0F1 ATP synthase subunit A [Anaerolineae bacterium]|jgi:F0F1-type ATP synthase membrane subunit a|nr:F0F1 ATP synthase subunit A [Anaerolineae bacterium]